MPDPDSDQVAAGNDPFSSIAGLRVREAVDDVALWTLRAASVGIVLDTDAPELAALVETGAGTDAADRAPLRALMLELVDAQTDPRDGDTPLRLVIRFDVDDLTELVGEIAAALTPAARRGLGLALLEVSS